MDLVKLDNLFTNSYFYGDDGFYVDVSVMISSSIPMFEAYLGHKDYGVKDFMFGIHQRGFEYDEFLDMIVANIDEYIDSYIEDHFA